MNKIIEKKDINELLKAATKDLTVYVPLKFMDQDVMMAPLPKEPQGLEPSLEKIALGDEDMVISPKDIFFPQLETLFSFKDGKIKETVESSAKLLFGVKACDLAGILFVDDFFKRNFEDAYYLSRIEERIIVTIGCLKPPRANACFCTSADTGPFAKKGFDLQLVDNGGYYIVEIGSARGEEFLAKHKAFFREAGADADKTAGEIKKKAGESLELKVDFQKVLKSMSGDTSNFDENYERIAQRCIHCGACLYTCPTCTCFNVYDNAVDGAGERVRCWDGCVFKGYTREASGHNPRREKALRAARRYEHKLKYDYAVTKTSGCVGCGRCLSSCPVNIGISKFIQEITEKRKVM